MTPGSRPRGWGGRPEYNGAPCQSPLRAFLQSHGASPRGRRRDRALQLALRAPPPGRVRAPHRGHRPRAFDRRVHPVAPRGAALARARLGRGSAHARLSPDRALRHLSRAGRAAARRGSEPTAAGARRRRWTRCGRPRRRARRPSAIPAPAAKPTCPPPSPTPCAWRSRARVRRWWTQRGPRSGGSATPSSTTGDRLDPRHPDLQLLRRRRRRDHEHHPRHPRRRSAREHAEADPLLPRPRLPVPAFAHIR